MSNATIRSSKTLTQQYCRKLHRALAALPEMRDRTVSQMTESILTYLDEHPDADYAALVETFGTPEQAAENVMNNMDAAQVKKALGRHRRRQFLTVALVCVILAGVVWAAGSHIVYAVKGIIDPPYIVVTVGESDSLPPSMAK